MNDDRPALRGAHRPPRLAWFFYSRTAWPVLIMAALGVVLAYGMVYGYDLYCHDFTTGLCRAVQTSPPWLLVTGLAAAPSALLTWYWRTDHKKRDLQNAANTHQLERRAKISERFAKAVELLAEARAGAIYALEQIARESPEDHWPVMQTLAAFARNNQKAISNDVIRPLAIEAVRVIGRRNTENDPPDAVIDLTGADLSYGDFRGAHLRAALLRGTTMNNANFDHAVLEGAALDRAYVPQASFCGADLRGVSLDWVSTYARGFFYDNATRFNIPPAILRVAEAVNRDETVPEPEPEPDLNPEPPSEPDADPPSDPDADDAS